MTNISRSHKSVENKKLSKELNISFRRLWLPPLTVHDDGEDAPDGGGDLVVVSEAGQTLVVVAPDTIDNIHELDYLFL